MISTLLFYVTSLRLVVSDKDSNAQALVQSVDRAILQQTEIFLFLTYKNSLWEANFHETPIVEEKEKHHFSFQMLVFDFYLEIANFALG